MSSIIDSQGTSTRFSPGMKSNLEIDYGKPHSKEFEKASKSPSFSTSYAMGNQQKDSGHIIVDLFADSNDSNEKKTGVKKKET